MTSRLMRLLFYIGLSVSALALAFLATVQTSFELQLIGALSAVVDAVAVLAQLAADIRNRPARTGQATTLSPRQALLFIMIVTPIGLIIAGLEILSPSLELLNISFSLGVLFSVGLVLLWLRAHHRTSTSGPGS